MLYQLTPSALPPGYGEAVLPLAACKTWLRVVEDDFDALIEILRDAAIDAVERYTNNYLAPRSGLVATYSCFDGQRGMRLPRGPEWSVEITSISYPGSDGAPVMMVEGDWRLLGCGLMPPLNARWPVAYGDVTVTFSAGYPAGAYPASLKSAALMFLAHLFANPEAVAANGSAGELPLGFRMQCDLHRMPLI